MKLTGAQIIIETLIEQGVETVFGYPGGTVLDIYDQLYKNSDRIQHVRVSHEQHAAHAADGYSRATGKVGVCIATSGPGATNLVTGIATAMLDSIAMVAITGNVGTPMIGKDSFQEIDITGITLPITKHNYFCNDITKLADNIREAFQIAKSGRPGPVLIDVPKDIQNAVWEWEKEPIRPVFENDLAREDKVQKAAKLINECKRPFIYIGGGAVGAKVPDQVLELADRIDAVIGCSFMGLSAIPTDHPRFLGMTGMHGHYASSMAQDQADLILGVGIRFSDRATGNKDKFAKGAKIIQLDIDFAEIGKNIPVDVGIFGDIKDAFTRIAEKVESKERPDWMARVEALKAEEAAQAVEVDYLTPKKVISIINEKTEADSVLATDVGQHQMWAAQFYNFRTKRTFASSGGLGTMGYGLGGAIGAAYGSGKRSVLITGDGSFGMNLNELATLANYQVPVTIVLFNNGTLGMVRQWQTLFYGKRYSNTTMQPVLDYVKLADAFGIKGYKVTDEAGFAAAFEEAYNSFRPALIDVKIDVDEMVLPMLPPGGSIEQMITKVDMKGGAQA
ncbi:MAG: biosynthetic-type acetolactate synthase large subunit [Firmicutes bacterium]|nr:biosynthetic-type acetolactate synthase large subunit [Bacillota bacterium]